MKNVLVIIFSMLIVSACGYIHYESQADTFELQFLEV
jgi:hypothetical protein